MIWIIVSGWIVRITILLAVGIAYSYAAKFLHLPSELALLIGIPIGMLTHAKTTWWTS